MTAHAAVAATCTTAGNSAYWYCSGCEKYFSDEAGTKEIEEGAGHLIEIENLIKKYNEKEKQCPLRLPDLKIVITGSQYGYRRPDDVFVIPIGCLKD